MTESYLREIVCDIGKRMYSRGLVAASDGNISVRLSNGLFLCTPSGVSKGDMSPQDIILTDDKGTKVSGAGKVTSEFFTHLAAYEERPDVNAVIHAHPPMATATTLAGISMLRPILPDLLMAMGGVPVAPYATPGSKEGGDTIRDAIKKCDTVLMDRHGAITVGRSLLEAWFKMEKLEHCAAILIHAHRTETPASLSKGQIDRLLASRQEYGVTWRCWPIGED